MLKQRVITGLILVAVMLAAIFLLPWFWFGVAAGLVFLIGAWEWSRLAGFEGSGRGVFTVVSALVLVAAALALGFKPEAPALASRWVAFVFALALAWWSLAFYLVRQYPDARWWNNAWIRSLAGALVLLPTWLALVYLRRQNLGEWLIVIVVASVGIADSGAYFVGRKLGKRKLAPRVSPGKSIEGMLGGLACSVVFALVLIVAIGGGTNTGVWWLLPMIVLASLVSVLGDLFESMLKRERGIKDSGSILPGHGGVLDRVDSITAAAPIFALVYLISGWQF